MVKPEPSATLIPCVQHVISVLVRADFLNLRRKSPPEVLNMETETYRKEYVEVDRPDEMVADEANNEPIPEDPTCIHEDYP
jgi:hypothetical protein